MDEKTKDENGLAAFGLTEEELAEPLPFVRSERDGRICSCGHPMSKHEEVDLTSRGRGVIRRCTPVRADCRCAEPKPVAEAQDTRQFIWKGKGHGAGHALVIGARASAEKGKRFEWLDGWPRCELEAWPLAKKRGVECSGALRPYGFMLDGSLSVTPEATMLVCEAHGKLLLVEGLNR